MPEYFVYDSLHSHVWRKTLNRRSFLGVLVVGILLGVIYYPSAQVSGQPLDLLTRLEFGALAGMLAAMCVYFGERTLFHTEQAQRLVALAFDWLVLKKPNESVLATIVQRAEIATGSAERRNYLPSFVITTVLAVILSGALKGFSLEAWLAQGGVGMFVALSLVLLTTFALVSQTLSAHTAEIVQAATIEYQCYLKLSALQPQTQHMLGHQVTHISKLSPASSAFSTEVKVTSAVLPDKKIDVPKVSPKHNSY